MSIKLDEYEEVVANCLHKIAKEVNGLANAITYRPKYTKGAWAWLAIPRPKIYHICPGITWPWVYAGGEVAFTAFAQDGKTYLAFDAAYKIPFVVDNILVRCRARPRAVLAAVRRLEAACDWVLKRKKGALRAVANLLQQQDRWATELRREHHLIKLGGGTPPPDLDP
jgi:hypothetical protein